MFEHATTNTNQGNIGEAHAIYVLTKKGYAVSRTLFDSSRYDLVVDIESKLYRVQVKSTRFKNKLGSYEVSLSTKGGNTKTNTIRTRETSDYDYLFVSAQDGSCWFIPSTELGTTAVVLGKKWEKYKV